MSYNGRPLFEDVSLDVDMGQQVTVTGPNGSGKTTFLKIVAGLVRPTSGEIRLQSDGEHPAETMEARRRVVGYAGPDVNAYDELSARENIAFYARVRAIPDSVGESLLERVGLSRPNRGRPLQTFSSGMRQRVRLAISMLGDPSILIWDEPTAMLDAAGRGVVSELLAAHIGAGGMALVATNDPAEIDRWGDRRIHFGG